MKYYSKIAVFDLDDTLYVGNSHIEILCEYYCSRIFDSIFFKIIDKILPTIHSFIMNRLYENIPNEKKINFILPFRKSVLGLLKEKQQNGFFILIVSNAPEQLIRNAAKKLNLEYLKAGVSRKGKVISETYKYDYLFVCTDNKTDIDLLYLANESVVTCKRKNYNFFKKHLKQFNYQFLVDEE